MPDEVVAATTSTEAAPAQVSVLGTSDQPKTAGTESVLDVAGQAEKEAQAVEEKRILEADPSTLKPEEVTKRDELTKAKEAQALKAATELRAKGVPEKYEFKLPEGVTLEQARLDKVSPIFKELGLSGEMAQKLIDLDLALKKEDAEAAQNNFKKFLDDSTKETMDALGSNAKSELAYVARVKGHLSQETIEILNSSGMGNVKSFIFDLAKIGRMLSEEKLVDTGRGSAAGKDLAETLYTSTQK